MQTTHDQRAREGDIVILDKDDHASIADGAFRCWGETRRFRHNEWLTGTMLPPLG
jgi:7-keto-8-aminopelargonate synthetase-like enzyme